MNIVLFLSTQVFLFLLLQKSFGLVGGLCQFVFIMVFLVNSNGISNLSCVLKKIVKWKWFLWFAYYCWNWENSGGIVQVHQEACIHPFQALETSFHSNKKKGKKNFYSNPWKLKSKFIKLWFKPVANETWSEDFFSNPWKLNSKSTVLDLSFKSNIKNLVFHIWLLEMIEIYTGNLL